MKKRRKPEVWKGLLAGLVGGLAGAGVMSVVHPYAAKLTGQEQSTKKNEDSTVKTASAVSENIFKHRLNRREKKIAGPAVHFAFGAKVGALYGALAESMPIVKLGAGTAYGTAVWLGAHMIAVPALGLSEPAGKTPAGEHAIELGGHLIYGLVTEGLRCLIRRAL